mgnify:CR=1 FL=1
MVLKHLVRKLIIYICACALYVRVCKISLSVTYVPPVPDFRDFYQKDMRVAHLRMLTGVLKLDFWGSRKVAFTFGAFRSDICVRRVPCFDHLFRYFLREKFVFFRLL